MERNEVVIEWREIVERNEVVIDGYRIKGYEYENNKTFSLEFDNRSIDIILGKEGVDVEVFNEDNELLSTTNIPI